MQSAQNVDVDAQDTAKSQTVASEVLVDLNRAGTGLMEIVTEPHMRSSDEAGAFVRKLQGLLRRVGSGDGDMEKVGTVLALRPLSDPCRATSASMPMSLFAAPDNPSGPAVRSRTSTLSDSCNKPLVGFLTELDA